MNRTEFVNHVNENILAAGYEVRPGAELLTPTVWDKLFPWFSRNKPLLPDLVVEKCDRKIAIEVYPRTILMSPIFKACTIREYFKIPIIICIPDNNISDIPSSVLDTANANNIAICSVYNIKNEIEIS